MTYAQTWRQARRDIRWAGPYKVASLADGEMRVTPAWPKLPKWNEQDGGGPSFGDRLEVAAAIEQALNRIC